MAAIQSTCNGAGAGKGRSSRSRRDDGPGFGPAPSSPTLTNPDMILPDYDYAAAAPFDGHSHSPISMWDSARDAADLTSFQPMPLTPLTPIIYGNGTMLSDIGEVTEVESTPGSHPRRMSSRQSGEGDSDGTPLRTSPTVGNKGAKRRTTHTVKSNPERRLSIESASTVNEPERLGPFGDFDDAVSVDDSNFQGDDEESMASSYMEGTSVDEPGSAARSSTQGLMNNNRFSTASISKRAELILANAKRRLNTMEGNLSMARSLSYSSISDGSTPSPIAQTATALAETTPAVSSSHSRNVSESGLQGVTARSQDHTQRSASALGSAGVYHQSLPLSRSADGLGGRYFRLAHKISHHPLDTMLATLSEDDDGNGHPAIFDAGPDGSSTNSVASPTSSSYSDAGTTRSTSVAQVRDLQDQMQDLKGKISSLKEQARADSMKRRSLQSLRTMSLFTHARWDPRCSEPRSVATPDQGSASSESPWRGTAPELGASRRPSSPEGGEAQALTEEHNEQSVSGGHQESQTARDDPSMEAVEASGVDYENFDGTDGAFRNGEDDVRTENGHIDGNGAGEANIVDSGSESGDSLYHDTHQHAVSHEDREDAFDYEHCFLHSAMGTLSRQGMDRGENSDSDASDDSAETTRGPVMSRVRRPSVDTFTTVDSFATATEGRVSRSSIVGRGGRTEDGPATPTQEYDDTEAGKPSSISEASDSGSGGGGNETDDLRQTRPRQNSMLHRPIGTSKALTLHRPSISSFESTGTNRSFPLVNKARLSGGILTPVGSPDHHNLKRVSESLMSETASICDKESVNGGPQSPAIQMLSREDKNMVEGVVASLGRCVLGLTEASRADAGAQAEFRRRIDVARKILEGRN